MSVVGFGGDEFNLHSPWIFKAFTSFDTIPTWPGLKKLHQLSTGLGFLIKKSDYFATACSFCQRIATWLGNVMIDEFSPLC